MGKTRKYYDKIIINEKDLPKQRKPMPPPTKQHKKKTKYNRKKDKKIYSEDYD